MKFFFCILILISFGINVSASSLEDTVSEVAFSTEWLRLLNYKKTLLGGYDSEADGENFFLTPNGKKDPKGELQALVFELMSRKAVTDDHARCRFPARSQFVSQKFGIPLPSEKNCIELHKFRQSFDAESISLVFSAYYINNPSSTFGHTFLRVNRKRDGNSSEDTELLDLGVNFAANPWTENPIIYTFGGIIGTFPGIFSTTPYYYKVREYNDFESRDLWSYKLNLTPDELSRFLDHLWELGQTHYDYFFFTENCSYHIFTALEAAAPRFTLSERLPYWAIPSDTILIANQTEGLIGDIHFRPSARNIFLSRYNKLNKEEKEEFLRTKDDPEYTPSSLPQDSQLKLIDTYVDWMEYKSFLKLQDKQSQESKKKNQLLIARTKFPPQKEDIKVETPAYKPHEGHPSMRYGLEVGYHDVFETFQRLHVRFALHDLMDPDFGYPGNMQIEFFNIQIQTYDDFKKWDLHQWTMVSVKSLTPFEEFERKLSWELLFGVKSYTDDQCSYCQGGYVSTSWGIAANLLPKATFYILATGELSYSEKYLDDQVRALVGPKMGVLYKPRDDFKFQLEGTWFWDPFQEYDSYQSEFTMRKALKKDYAFGLSAKSLNDTVEGSLQLYIYK